MEEKQRRLKALTLIVNSFKLGLITRDEAHIDLAKERILAGPIEVSVISKEDLNKLTSMGIRVLIKGV